MSQILPQLTPKLKLRKLFSKGDVNMKITGLSSHIKVHDFEGKSMVIEGEMIVNGFVAYKSSMTHWEEPNRHLNVSDEDRNRLINAVIEESKNKGFSIEFE